MKINANIINRAKKRFAAQPEMEISYQFHLKIRSAFAEKSPENAYFAFSGDFSANGFKLELP